MPNIVADLLVKLGLDTSKYSQGIKGAIDKTKKFKISLKAMTKAGGIALLAGGIAAGKELIEAQDSIIGLTGTMKALGVATQGNVQGMIKLANTYQKKTNISDDKIVEAMNDYLKITKDYNSVAGATPAILELAAGAQLDLKTAAIAVGRAYNGDVRILKSYGIYVKEGTSKTEALKAITDKYSGQSAVNMAKMSGKVAGVQNLLSDTLQDVGESVSNLFTKTKEMNGMNNDQIRAAKAIIAVEGIKKGAYTDTAESLQDEIDAMEEAEKVWKESQEAMAQTISDTSSVLGPAVSSIVTTMLDAEATMNEKMGAILRASLNAILDAVGIQIKAYIAAETAKAIGTGGLTAATVAATAAQLVAVEGLKAAVGTISLAEGGIAYSPVSAIVGDSTSPEVVAPLHKLQPMITKAVSQSMSNKMTFVIQSNGLDNARDIVRKQIAPELDKYFRKRGGSFYGTN